MLLVVGAERKRIGNYLSTAEVAKRLGVTNRHVTRLVNTEAIEIIGTFGAQKHLVFREEDVDAYIAAHDQQ